MIENSVYYKSVYLCSVHLYVCSYDSTAVSWLLQFWSKFLNWQVWNSHVFLLFQEYFRYSESLSFLYEFKDWINLSISADKPAEILIEIELNLKIDVGNIAILTILSLPAMNMDCLSIYIGV